MTCIRVLYVNVYDMYMCIICIYFCLYDCCEIVVFFSSFYNWTLTITYPE